MSDVIVVGGGSSGAVLAARLSEDPARQVTLVEAGPDDITSPQLLDSSAPTTEFDWGYETSDGKPLPRAKVIGGCSATNATFALRGARTNYDEWPGWSWNDVLPFFCKAEDDHDFHDDYHGRSGPLPIRRTARDALPEYQQAMLAAANTLGHPSVDDHNAPGAIGAGPVPRNIGKDGQRVSTARAYLPAARDRPNFRIVANATVDRVTLSGVRATGIQLANGEHVAAGEVVLSAGSYGSPAILLRSGIGPAGAVVDLPVGENLIEHPMFTVDVLAHEVPPADWFQSVVTYASDWAGADPYDMHLAPGGAFVAGPGVYVFFCLVGVMRPRGRGRLTLVSADPNAAPRIELAGLREPEDLLRMRDGVERARALMRESPLRELIVGDETRPGPDVVTADQLDAYLTREVGVYHHPVGTCAMGSVVDTEGRVLGVDGLRVADASIMPNIPAANTNLPAIMLGERIAAMMGA